MPQSQASSARPPTGTAGQRCPVCGAPTVFAHRPFCSSRCKDVDLSRWLAGVYVLPGGADGEEGSVALAAAQAEKGDPGEA